MSDLEGIDLAKVLRDLVRTANYDHLEIAPPERPWPPLQYNYLQAQLHLSDAEALRPEVIPVCNIEINPTKPAPGTGFWTSTWLEKQQSSAWIPWCTRTSPRRIENKYWFVLNPAPNARVATINGLANLERLLHTYRRVFTGRRAYLTEFGYLDFERLAQNFDAIHLTAQGQRETRLTIPNLYGWDVESTLWLRWCFTEVQRIDPTVMKREE